MKKKLLLMGLLIQATVTQGASGLFGSQVNYQDVVLVTAVGTLLYAYNACGSLAQYGDVLKQYLSIIIGCGAGIAVLYSDQFNDMIPKSLHINEFFKGLNTVLPYWFGIVIAGATYSNFCDRYDAFFKGKEKEKKEQKKPTVTVDVNA